jgi:hypothetical protein
MMAGGLFENMEKVSKELYKGLSKSFFRGNEVLLSDVFPIKMNDGTYVFVIAVNKQHWDLFNKEIVERWNEFLQRQTNLQLSLVFQNKNDIPRTAPPLLKPLKNVMKQFLERYSHLCGEGKQTPWYYLSSISILTTTNNDAKEYTSGWCG